jgi:Domain of unknown function (DUF5664)
MTAHCKEKCEHGHSLYAPTACPKCSAYVPYPYVETESYSNDVKPWAILPTFDELAARLEAEASNTKPSNPKDALGIRKVPITTVPQTVIAELGVAMLEGALKYGRHNYRAIGVKASVYIDAADRHTKSFWEGEDIDPDSKLSHVTKAIASLTVLRDAMICNNWVDDRPPRPPAHWMKAMNDAVAALLTKYPEPVHPYTHVDNTWIYPSTPKPPTA